MVLALLLGGLRLDDERCRRSFGCSCLLCCLSQTHNLYRYRVSISRCRSQSQERRENDRQEPNRWMDLRPDWVSSFFFCCCCCSVSYVVTPCVLHDTNSLDNIRMVCQLIEGNTTAIKAICLLWERWMSRLLSCGFSFGNNSIPMGCARRMGNWTCSGHRGSQNCVK